jgi:hypothetical protein
MTLCQSRAFSVLLRQNRLGGQDKITPMSATGRKWEQEQRWRSIFFANGGAAPEGRGDKLGTHGMKVRSVGGCGFECVGDMSWSHSSSFSTVLLVSPLVLPPLLRACALTSTCCLCYLSPLP